MKLSLATLERRLWRLGRQIRSGAARLPGGPVAPPPPQWNVRPHGSYLLRQVASQVRRARRGPLPLGLGDPSRANLVLMITSPRSGTNFAAQRMAGLGGVLGLTEVFNPDGAFGLTRRSGLQELFLPPGTGGVAQEDKRLVRAVRRDPALTLDKIAEAARAGGHVHVFFKLFGSELLASEVQEILDLRPALVLFQSRRRIDTTVSFLKALEVSAWKKVDTSGVTVRAEMDDLLAFHASRDTFLDFALQDVRRRGLPHAFLDYDRDIDRPAEAVDATFADLLRRHGLETRVPDGPVDALPRQDRRTGDPFDRLENGAELRADLSRKGRLDYALSSWVLEAEAGERDRGLPAGPAPATTLP